MDNNYIQNDEGTVDGTLPGISHQLITNSPLVIQAAHEDSDESFYKFRDI